MITAQNQNWFGNPNILDRFSMENEDFIKNTLPLLQRAFELVHEEIGQIKPLNKTQTTLSTLSILACEDFFEILTLCGFGKGNGAKKILRGMFERIVTLCYLKDNPGEIENLWRFGEVSAYKRAKTQKKLGRITGEEFAQIEEAYKAIEGRFKTTDCKTCKTTRTNFSWSKVDIVTMSERVGLYNLIDELYYDPMQETHTSVSAFRARVTTREIDGKYYLDYKLEPDWLGLKILIERANYLFATGLMALYQYFSFSEDVKQSLKAYNDSSLRRIKDISSSV